MKEVKVIVKGGVVQDVDVPEGVVVKVYDYDVGNVDPELDVLDEDETGTPCEIGVWEHLGGA